MKKPSIVSGLVGLLAVSGILGTGFFVCNQLEKKSKVEQRNEQAPFEPFTISGVVKGVAYDTDHIRMGVTFSLENSNSIRTFNSYDRYFIADNRKIVSMIKPGDKLEMEISYSLQLHEFKSLPTPTNAHYQFLIENIKSINGKTIGGNQ